ncbi:hypothetical protein V493_08291 [Pseudogymnoascus sp. VKM F-4281 (FW-2241)]|nr:hypothetical protein V493_08291 [Pseudogymnoascus sp. VKM F-4281 (FW-2241)]
MSGVWVAIRIVIGRGFESCAVAACTRLAGLSSVVLPGALHKRCNQRRPLQAPEEEAQSGLYTTRYERKLHTEAKMGVPFETLIPFAIMLTMFGITGAGLSKVRAMQNGGKRGRHSVDQWDSVRHSPNPSIDDGRTNSPSANDGPRQAVNRLSSWPNRQCHCAAGLRVEQPMEVGEAIPLNRPQEVNTTARDNKMYIFESIKNKTKPSMYQVSVVIVGKNLGLEPMAGRATFNA